MANQRSRFHSRSNFILDERVFRVLATGFRQQRLGFLILTRGRSGVGRVRDQRRIARQRECGINLLGDAGGISEPGVRFRFIYQSLRGQI
jgi:hypothetical protein